MRRGDDPVIAGRRRYSEADVAALEAGWRCNLAMWSVIAWAMGAATVEALRLVGCLG